MRKVWLVALAFVLLFSMSASAFAALVDPRAPHEGEINTGGPGGETYTFIDCDLQFKVDEEYVDPGEWTKDGITVTVYTNPVSGKTEFDFSSTTKMIMKVAVKGGSATYPYPPMPWGEPNAAIDGQWIYDYMPGGAMSDTGLRAPNNDAGNQADLSNIVFCFETRDVIYGEISAKKWYDRDKDGKWDVEDPETAEPPLAGWKINLTDGVDTWCALTDANGAVTFENLLPGKYWLSEEVAPVGSGWEQTYPEGNEYVIELAEGDIKTGYLFGNVCEATSEGGYTLGWWSNKNGAKALGDDWAAFLMEMNLVDKYGDDVDFGTYAAFRSWLLKAEATNMSYMLSVQMAVTNLNIKYMDTNYDGFGVVGWDGEWISIADLLLEADAFLAANPDTTEAGAKRDEAEFYKNIFDGLNNNKQKIIPFDPCPVPVWSCE